MPLELFNKTNIPLLAKSLDAYSLRHKVIAGNIANTATPGYRRREVVFEEDLRRAMRKGSIKAKATHPNHIIGARHFQEVRPKVIRPNDTSNASGVNNVDVDKEMAELAKNQLKYYMAAQFIAGTFKALKMSITGTIQ